MLEEAGYAVLVAAGGEEALALSDGHGADIDLLISDVVMPGMSGPEFAEEVRRRRPGIPVVHM